MTHRSTIDRRALLGLAAALVPALAWAASPPARPFVAPVIKNPIPRTAAPMKIGVIGSGNVGGTLGELWSRAGHQVMFSDRDPAAARARAERLPGARAGTIPEAIAFADVVLIAVPLAALADVAQAFGPQLRGKIVFDPNNPNAERDGADLAAAALAKGTGVYVASLFPGATMVRGFNTMAATQMAGEAARPGGKGAVALAANDPAAMAAGAQLVRDAGFEPVQVGGLATSGRFELRGPASGVHTAAELRRLIGLPPA
jgi:predicted dinucleotide-binding enzyme